MKRIKKNLFAILFFISFLAASPVVLYSFAGGPASAVPESTETEPFIFAVKRESKQNKQTEEAPQEEEASPATEVMSAAEALLEAGTTSKEEATAPGNESPTTEPGATVPGNETPTAGLEATAPGNESSAAELGATAPGDESSAAETGAASLSDTLFIGDSRTVGLSEYGGLTETDFFANIGMSVFNLGDAVVSVPGVGKVSLVDLLAKKHYGKIYIMLGINEIGYPFDQITEEYENWLEQIQDMQPEAVVYVCANLHLSASRSDGDPVYNNRNLNRLNEAIREYADGKTIFYIDVNECFDDAQGNLGAQYTGDGAHVLGKYYRVWAEWLCTKAAQR